MAGYATQIKKVNRKIDFLDLPRCPFRIKPCPKNYPRITQNHISQSI